MENDRLYSLLAILGALPFVACAALPQFGIDALPLLGDLERIANSYGLAIACFLAGIHWATQLYLQEDSPGNLFLVSNAVFLTAVFAYLVLPAGVSLVVLAGCLLVLLGIDATIYRKGIVSRSYLKLRGGVTTVACASLLVLAVT